MKDTVGLDWALEDTSCPVCGSTDARATSYDANPFKIKRCNGCDHWYLSPRLAPQDIQRFYESPDYFGGGETGVGYANYDTQERSLRATFAKLLVNLDRHGLMGGELLEVGCGPGYLLDEARGFFDSLTGIELSPPTAKLAEETSGAKVYLSHEALPRDAQFDLIVGTHVIEHIYEPVAFVRELAQHLKPGGAMVLAAPHMGSLLRYLMGRRWPSFKYPEHVSYFDAKTLADMMRRAGLEVAGRLPYPHAFPLSLILGKLGISAPGWSDRIDVTLPATTICILARKVW